MVIVTPSIRKTYKDLIKQVVEDLHKPIVIHLEPNKADCPNCFEAGTLVDTPSGLKAIEEFYVGDLVYDGKGDIRKVNRVIHREVETEFTTIKTHGNSLGITATSNHKVPAFVNKGKPYSLEIGPGEKTEIGKIEKGYLVSHVIRSLPSEPKESFLFQWKANRYGPKKSIDEKIEVTDDFLFAYGLYLAEGCTSKGRQVQYCLNRNELAHGERVCSYWQQLLNVNYSLCGRKASEENAIFELYSSHLADFVDKKCGHLAENKFICSDLYYKLDRRQTMVLLKALYLGDGHVESRLGSNVLGTVSKRLALQTYNLLLSCGYAASVIFTPSREGGDGIKRQPVYAVRYWDEPEFQLRGTKVQDSVLYLAVKEVRKDTKSTEVYNLEIDTEHSYSADGIVVGNCHYDFINKRSSGEFDTSFVTPVVIFGATIDPILFSRSRCPICFGEGQLTEDVTRNVKALVRWNPTPASELEILPVGREGAAVVRIKVLRTDYDSVVGATHFLIDGVRCELIQPVTVRGLGVQEELVVAFLQEVEPGKDVKK